MIEPRTSMPPAAAIDPALAGEMRALLTVLRAAAARLEGLLAEPDHTSEPEMLSTTQAARVAHVTPQSARNWCKRYAVGRLRRGRWEIDRRLLEAFLRDRD